MSLYVEQGIDETTLVYSNIPDIVAAYNPATTYTIGLEARIGDTIYKSTADGNTGNYPLENLGVYWIVWGVSNAHAMFDLLEPTGTTWTADGIIEFVRGGKDTLGIGNYRASNIKIEYKDALGVVLETVNYATPRNQGVFDPWDYVYVPVTFAESLNVFLPLKKLGTTIRVTFQREGLSAFCGYCVAGAAVNMGNTLNKVALTNRTIGSTTAAVANFTTSIEKKQAIGIAFVGKQKIDIPAMIVIDPSVASSHKNLVILGKIKKCDLVAEVLSNNYLSWEIEQNVEV